MSGEDPKDRRHSPPDDRTRLWFHEIMSEFETSLKNHVDSKFAQFYKDAFPNGDAHGHRAAHEKAIKRAERWEDMKAAFITKAFTGGTYAAGAFILLLIWEWIKQETKK